MRGLEKWGDSRYVKTDKIKNQVYSETGKDITSSITSYDDIVNDAIYSGVHSGKILDFTEEIDVEESNRLNLSKEAYEAFDKELKSVGLSARTFGGMLKIYRNRFGGGIKSIIITKRKEKNEQQ